MNKEIKLAQNDDDIYETLMSLYIDLCENVELNPIIQNDGIGCFSHGEINGYDEGEDYIASIDEKTIVAKVNVSKVDKGFYIYLMQSLVDELDCPSYRRYKKIYYDRNENEIEYEIDVEPSTKLEMTLDHFKNRIFIMSVIGKITLV